MLGKFPRSFCIVILLLFCVFVIGQCFGQMSTSIQIVQDRTLSLVNTGDFTAANTVIEKLKIDFADDARLAEGLCQIAYKYDQLGDVARLRSGLRQARQLFSRRVFSGLNRLKKLATNIAVSQ